MKSFQLHYDQDYGIDHKSGWSVIYDGIVVNQFTNFYSVLFTLIKCLLIGE